MQPVRARRFPDRYLAAKPAVVRTAVPVRDVRLARSRRRRCRLLPPTSTYLELLVGRTSRREARRTPRRRRPRAQRQFHFGSGVEGERRRSRVDGEFQVFRVTVVSPDFARRWFRPGRVRRRAARRIVTVLATNSLDADASAVAVPGRSGTSCPALGLTRVDAQDDDVSPATADRRPASG